MSKIEIRARDVKGFPYIPFKGNAQHLFIIYTDILGQEFILRGGPDTNKITGDLKISMETYTKSNVDWAENAPSIILAKGADQYMQNLVNKMWARAEEINIGNFDYKLPTPGCSENICHVQNSNKAVKEMIKAAGLELKLPVIGGREAFAPGIDGEIEKTILDDFTDKFSKEIKSQQDAVADLFALFDQPEIKNPELTNSERFRLLAKQEQDRGDENQGYVFNSLANQLDAALDFMAKPYPNTNNQDND
jgi:hypothetical protein